MRTNLGKPEHSAYLVSVLFSRYHRELLSLLLLRPDEGFHVREIERITDIPAGSAHRELKRLSQAGLLTRTPVGNQVHYRADRSCPIFDELAAIFRKTTGLADVVRDALQLLAARGKVDFAFIFGSVAQGKEGQTSDVDLLVVGSASFTEVVEATHATIAHLRREVNPVVMAPADFRAKRAQGDRFVTRIMAEPKIVLIGNTDELGEPG